MRNNFRILFYTKKKQPLKNGYYPILCRITINGMACAFSTNLSVKPSKWDNVQKRVIGRSREARQINNILDEIRFSIYETYMKLRHKSEQVTPQAVKRAYLGVGEVSNGVMKFFKQHNNEFKQMVGITRSQSTLYKYRYVHNHLQNYISERYHSADLPLNKVNVNFVRDFHRWLICNARCSINTTWLYMIAFKHIITLAVNQGEIAINPFIGYRLRSEQTHRNFLHKNEIKRLMKVEIHNSTEALVRDAFIFSCFTGLSYSDIKALKSSDIMGEGGDMYIATQRIKTHTSLNIPISRIPTELIKRYRSSNSQSSIFPLPSNYWCNNILKRLIGRTTISKHITFHSARHTFATTVTLSEGVPIEVVSNMLGHTNIKTTQTYAKVLQCVVNSEMHRAAKNLNSYFSISSKQETGSFDNRKILM